MSAPQRWPLAWPKHRPRRKPVERLRGVFVVGGKRPTLAGAVARLEDQITRLGGVLPILSSNVELRMDGVPRADRGPPADPGVCVYFQLKGKPVTMPCDTFTEVAQNILGIANHIEATRRIEAYGVGTASETLQAFMALPSAEPAKKTWREVMGWTPNFPGDDLLPDEVRDMIESRFKRLSKERHPDAGGTPELFAELTAARGDALREFSA